MPRKFTYADVRPWKVITRAGKVLRDKDGKRLNNLSGYRDADKLARKLGGVAVRA
jgi:hypothetical protein